DVQQVYPPANLTGQYEESLPHVVFRLPTLPWSRTIDGSAASGDTVTTPWLALLTLYPDELMSGSTPITIQQMTLNDLLSPAQSNVLGPVIDKSQFTPAELAQPLLAIDIPSAVFNGVTPSIADLSFLAHARQVNTDGKEILGLVADGYFSVVIGNRLPKTGAQNSALVVSLEGQQSRIRGNTLPPANTFVRVAVLASWNFTAAAARGDFIEILRAIPDAGGVELLQMPHDEFTGTLTTAETTAQEALETGYVPLLNNTRAGEETTSWYRSPGVPEATSLDPFGPYAISDMAIRYDPGPMDDTTPGSGLFNVTYACAWQIGRLLALSDSAFARMLYRWRVDLHNNHDDAQLVADLALRLPSLARMQSPTGEPIRRLDAAPWAFTDFWLNAGRLLEQANLPRVVRHEHRSDARLPGVLAPDALRAVAESDDPLTELLQRILNVTEVTP
ncbi:MAG TPA: hypothetical protein VK504_01070, partial [Vicinamibacterales bacterium]|nr:hypothetical protein [Vicinamibacterales bacterium]